MKVEAVSTSAWATGRCPYGLVCDSSSACPEVEFDVSTEVGEEAKSQGFDVSDVYVPGYTAATDRFFSRIHICDRALGINEWFDKTAKLESKLLKEEHLHGS